MLLTVIIILFAALAVLGVLGFIFDMFDLRSRFRGPDPNAPTTKLDAESAAEADLELTFPPSADIPPVPPSE